MALKYAEQLKALLEGKELEYKGHNMSSWAKFSGPAAALATISTQQYASPQYAIEMRVHVPPPKDVERWKNVYTGGSVGLAGCMSRESAKQVINPRRGEHLGFLKMVWSHDLITLKSAEFIPKDATPA